MEPEYAGNSSAGRHHSGRSLKGENPADLTGRAAARPGKVVK